MGVRNWPKPACGSVEFVGNGLIELEPMRPDKLSKTSVVSRWLTGA